MALTKVTASVIETGIIDSTHFSTDAITGHSELSSIDHASDYLLIYDASAGSLKKVLAGTLHDFAAVAESIVPATDVTYDLGSTTHRWRDLYLSGSTIDLGGTKLSIDNDGHVEVKDGSGNRKKLKIDELDVDGKTLTKTDILDFDLDIAPEVLDIQVDATDPGDDVTWKWTWLQSTLPYSRIEITNSTQLSVPLYKKGTYTVNNFAAHELHDNLNQLHRGYFKWIDGAGTDNLVSWATYTLNVDESHPDINGGNVTEVQQFNVVVPEVVTPPTLNLPQNIGYDVSFSTPGAYTFGAHMMHGGDTSSVAEGDNPNIGPFYRGATYTFTLDASLAGAHPFYLTTDNGTGFISGQYVGEYTTGVTGSRNDGSTGKTTLTFTVPADAPDTLYYQCGVHQAMRGVITIRDLEVEVNENGNYVIYFQHTHEGHKTPIEIRPIPSLVNQMCLVFDAANSKFVPQDLATYVENTPSFKNKIKEVAGTATLVAPDGSSLVASVNIYSDSSYLPFVGNTDGDIAYTQDNNTMYIWDTAVYNWVSTKVQSTTELAEGSNLYYTDARARASISASDGITYNSSTGALTLTDTGVTAGSYGSASQVPVITINANGQITSASTTAVAGVSSVSYTASTGVLTINTSDGGTYTNDLGIGTGDSPTFTDLTLSGGDLILSGTGRIQGIDTVSAGTDAANKTYVDTAVANLVASAPGTLDTLNELAAALGDDANFSTTVTTSIGTKANKTVTISAGTGLTGGGDLTANRTLALATSGVTAGSYGSSTAIPVLTVDAYGRVTAASTTSITVGNATITLSAGSGMSGGGDFTTNQTSNETITFSHADTSSQASVNNSNGTVIQDITLDTYGHITGLASVDLDGRYYTESEADSRFVNVTGDTMTGDLKTTNIQLSSTTPTIWFNGTADGGDGASSDMAIKATPEGLDFFEPEDANKIQFQILDDTGVNAPYGYKVGSTQVIDSSGNVKKSPTLTLSGDASGSCTFTDLGNATLTVVVADDSHNHIISNVDGLQTALDAKLASSSYTAADVLTKIKTVDGSGSGLDADTVDGQHLSDLDTRYVNTSGDTMTGDLKVSAKVGIGTLTPSAQLHVYGPSFPLARIERNTSLTTGMRSTFSAIHTTSANMTDGFGADVSFGIRDSAGVDNEIANFGAIRDGADNSGALVFATTLNGTQQGTPKMILKSSGNVGIGTNYNPDANYKLDVNGTIRATGDVISDSDRRLKSDIKPISNALQTVQALSGKAYIKDDKANIGLIAQEVEEVMPFMVHTANDEIGTKSVNYQNMVALLIEAIKEQQDQIDELKRIL